MKDFVIKLYSRNSEIKKEENNFLIVDMDDILPQNILDYLEELKNKSFHVQSGGKFDYGIEAVKLPDDMSFIDPDIPIERIWYVAKEYKNMISDIQKELNMIPNMRKEVDKKITQQIFSSWYSENFMGFDLFENFSPNLLDSFKKSFIGIHDSEENFIKKFFKEQKEIIIDEEKDCQIEYIKTKESGIIFIYDRNMISYIPPITDEECYDYFYETIENNPQNNNRMKF